MSTIYRARAPARIDLAGGWTDVAPYAAREGGAVVSVAITLHAHASIRRRRGGVRLRIEDHNAVVTARRAAELRPDGEFGLLKAAVRRLGPEGGFELMTRGDYPLGSGLGGSGAMGVALVAALRALRGEQPMPLEVAREAHEIEVRDAGIMGGKQDQYTAALGGIQFMEFGDPSVRVTPLGVPPDGLRELEHQLILCYSGASRLSGATHERVWSRYANGDQEVARALNGLKACALAMRDALLSGDLGAVGEILTENWAHQRALGAEIETDTMRAHAQAAAAAGAPHLKACGAGAGGCLVFLARPGHESRVAEALRAAGGTVLPFTFDTTGVVTWTASER